jgi:saccharopine dehydrogenase-like NADP-dependent oxidoreductase
MAREKTVVLLGAAGIIGQVIAWDWIRFTRYNIILADRDGEKVRLLAKKLGPRTRAVVVNLFNRPELVRVLKLGSLVINSTSHHFNLPVMAAALQARVHYMDLGGLFHFTRRQLKLGKKFEKAGRIAILGMGCSPGATNVMARAMTEGWEKVRSVEIKLGAVEPPGAASVIPYSFQTLYEEFTQKPAVFDGGKYKFVKPLTSGKQRVRFCDPVGEQEIIYTIHSEVATLPGFFQKRGIRHCSFRIGLGQELQDAVLKRKVKRKPKPVPARIKNLTTDYESMMVCASGQKNGKRARAQWECLARGRWGWRAGDLDTACPASIVARLVLDKKISAIGTHAPEACVPWTELENGLRKRGFRFLKKQF